jgi:hypothetical protein
VMGIGLSGCWLKKVGILLDRFVADLVPELQSPIQLRLDWRQEGNGLGKIKQDESSGDPACVWFAGL